MTDLREFLRSRVERDLRVAQRLVDDFATQDEAPPIADAYVQVFSPGRLRAETTERLRLLDLHETAQGRELIGCCEPDGDVTQCVVLRAMAISFLDDTDYDLGWGVT